MTRARRRRPPPPPHWEADIVAADGGTVHLRPICPEDADGIDGLMERSSDQTRYYRFFGPMKRLSEKDLHRFTHVDHVDRVAFVRPARRPADRRRPVRPLSRHRRRRGRLPRRGRPPGPRAGLGAARAPGRRRPRARHQAVRRRGARPEQPDGAGLPGRRLPAAERSYEDGVVHLTFPIEQTEDALAVAYEREQRSESRSIAPAAHARRSVAVVGASNDEGKIGNALLRHLLDYGFAGPVYPVNPAARHVRGVPAYADIEAIPDDVDLAVARRARRRGRRRGGGLPAQAGPRPGRRLRRVRRDRARGAGGRARSWSPPPAPRACGWSGPTASASSTPTRRCGSTPASRRWSPAAAGSASSPSPARSAWRCWSGRAAATSGCPRFVSAGNRADVSGNDLLQYWATDPATEVVLLHLESFGNPRKFARLARSVGRTKPVVAVKSGRHVQASPAGWPARRSRCPSSRWPRCSPPPGSSGSRPWPSCSTSARCWPTSRCRPGDRVGDRRQLHGDGRAGRRRRPGGGAASWRTRRRSTSAPTARPRTSAAALQARGRRRRRRRGRRGLPAAADGRLGGVRAGAARGGPRLGQADRRELPVHRGHPAELAVLDERRHAGPRLGAVVLHAGARGDRAGQGRPSTPAGGAGRWASCPELPDVDEAAGRGRRRTARWPSARRAGSSPTTELHRPARAPTACRCWAPGRVDDAEAAVAAAEEIGYPVVLKSTAPWLRHRPDLGGVRLDLADADGRARRVRRDPGRRPGDRAGDGRARAWRTVVEIVDDPSFGALVSFGLGGVATDLLGDRAYRTLPLTDLDAAELVRAPRAWPLLDGYRGSEPVDVAALEDLLLRVARLADDLPEVLRLTPGAGASSGRPNPWHGGRSLVVAGGTVRDRPADRARRARPPPDAPARSERPGARAAASPRAGGPALGALGSVRLSRGSRAGRRRAGGRAAWPSSRARSGGPARGRGRTACRSAPACAAGGRRGRTAG